MNVDDGRLSLAIIHVLLTFHLRVYYDFLRLTYEQSRLCTIPYDSRQLSYTRDPPTVQIHWRFRLLSSAESLIVSLNNEVDCWKIDITRGMSGTNKHTLGGGSEVSVNGRRAAGRAAWWRGGGRANMIPAGGWQPMATSVWLIDVGECHTYCVCK